jgi:hypothetical protein
VTFAVGSGIAAPVKRDTAEGPQQAAKRDITPMEGGQLASAQSGEDHRRRHGAVLARRFEESLRLMEFEAMSASASAPSTGGAPRARRSCRRSRTRPRRRAYSHGEMTDPPGPTERQAGVGWTRAAQDSAEGAMPAGRPQVGPSVRSWPAWAVLLFLLALLLIVWAILGLVIGLPS